MKIAKWIILGVVLLVVAGATIFTSTSTASSAGRSSRRPPHRWPCRRHWMERGSVLGGMVSLSDLKVGSPQGFDAPQMFALGGASVDVSYGELRKEPIHIDEVVIDAPHLVIEQKDGKFNFQTLMQQDSKPPGEGEPIKLVVNSLKVNNSQVTLRPGIPGLENEIQIPIPSFDLKNVGSGEGAAERRRHQAGGDAGGDDDGVQGRRIRQAAARSAALLKGNVEEVAKELATKYGEKVLADIVKDLPPEIGGAVGDVLKGEDPARRWRRVWVVCSAGKKRTKTKK